MDDAPESCVRLFLSVDLVGSTDFKNKSETTQRTKYSPPREGEGGQGASKGVQLYPGPAWASVFVDFYRGFPTMFERKLGDSELPESLRPTLVKTLGDEVLLQTKISRSWDANLVVSYFARALAEYKRKNLSEVATASLHLKGAAWIAGFPINNHAVRLDDGKTEDFIGPSIDTGFRIAKFATPNKLVVSADLALLLLFGQHPLPLYFDGTETLKGVLNGRPYPLIWHKVDGQDAELHAAELRLTKQQANVTDLRDYCRAFIAGFEGSWLIEPYFPDGTDEHFRNAPSWHLEAMKAMKRTDQRNLDMGKEPEEAPRSSKSRKGARKGTSKPL